MPRPTSLGVALWIVDQVKWEGRLTCMRAGARIQTLFGRGFMDRNREGRFIAGQDLVRDVWDLSNGTVRYDGHDHTFSRRSNASSEIGAKRSDDTVDRGPTGIIPLATGGREGNPGARPNRRPVSGSSGSLEGESRSTGGEIVLAFSSRRR